MKNEEMKAFYAKSKEEVTKFICRIDGLYVYVMNNMLDYLKKALAYEKTTRGEVKKLEKVMNELEKDTSKEVSTEARIKLENFKNLKSKQKETQALLDLIPSSMIVTLISSFDYCLSRLIKVAYNFNPDILMAEKKGISIQEIGDLESMADVKNYFIDKIIDAQFRESHMLLFEYIEKTFSIKGIKEFCEYKNILFISEIRNIIVHNDGFLNVEFKNCIKKYGVNINYDFMFDENNKLRLELEQINFVRENLICFFVKLFYVFVFHFCKKNKQVIENLSNEINNIALKYYQKRNYNISLSIFNFMLQEKLKSSDKFMYTVNKCMCLKSMGRMDEVNKVLHGLDWSNCDRIFLFAKFLLLDDFENALKYIKENPDDMEYKFQFWPICKPLIKKNEFRILYKTLYGKDFSYKIHNGLISKDEIEKIVDETRLEVENENRNNTDDISENVIDQNIIGELSKEEIHESNNQSEN